MTRTTLKALWFGGGGILATWLAVSPNHGVPTTTPPSAVRHPASTTEPTAEHLSKQAARLRDRTGTVTLRPSTRNPFRYASPKSSAASSAARDRGAPPMVMEPAIPAAPAPPVLRLSGVAEKAGRRSAILVGDGQIYVVGEGELVAGRYTVIKVDPEAVLLRDASGAEERLVLPQ